MRVSTVQTLAAYLDDEITAMPNLVTVGAGGTASTVAGIPFYQLTHLQFTHMMFLEQMILHQAILHMVNWH